MKPAGLLLAAAVALALDPAGAARDYVEAKYRAGRFAGAVLVVREGKTILRAAYGPANAEHNAWNTPETKFRLGSITKQFTAAAVMQLRERGKLQLEDPLDKFFSPCPEPWKKVTLHHLLTHTSGIPSYTSDAGLMKRSALALSLPDLIATFRAKPLEFEPGSKMLYDNSGYVLLGAVIEKVSGLSYEDYLRQNIFEPLGMKNTGYDHFETVLANRAVGYVRTGGTLAHAPFLSMSIPHAAGALYSTVDDLKLWSDALDGDKLLPQAAIEKMYTPFKNDYGYGLVIKQVSGRRQIGHGGGINGFDTIILRYPAEKVFVAALSNLQTPGMEGVGRDLAAIAFGEKIEAGQSAVKPADPKLYDAYVGQYELQSGFYIRVTSEEGRLMAQATGQGKAEIFPESENKFFYKVVDAKITFEKDRLILHQNGRDLPAPRVKMEPAKVRQAVPVDEKVLDGYAGVYELAPGFTLTVKRDGGKLRAQATGQPEFPLFGESETEFFYTVVEATVTFSKDRLVLRQGGRDIEGKRVQ